MPPRLPAELLQHILALALEDGSPGVRRQQTRHRFGLVCVAWYFASGRWREVDVVGSNQADRLAEVLRLKNADALDAEEASASAGAGVGVGAVGEGAPTRRLAVRSMWLDLSGGEDAGEGVVRLLKFLDRLGRLSVVVADEPTDRVVNGLAGLRGLRHLTVRGAEGRLDRPRITASWLGLCLAHLPQLESLTLDHAWLTFGDGPPPAPGTASTTFAASLKLRHVSISTPARDTDYIALLASLPPTLDSLHLDDAQLHLEGIDRLLVRHLCLAALPRLAGLSLTDRTTPCPLSCGRVGRGALDALLDRATATATGLERLTLSPCAVSNLGNVLASWPGLAELELKQGGASPCRALGTGEVVEFLARARGLRRLGVCGRTRAGWGQAGEGEVAEAGRRRGVKVVWG